MRLPIIPVKGDEKWELLSKIIVLSKTIYTKTNNKIHGQKASL